MCKGPGVDTKPILTFYVSRPTDCHELYSVINAWLDLQIVNDAPCVLLTGCVPAQYREVEEEINSLVSPEYSKKDLLRSFLKKSKLRDEKLEQVKIYTLGRANSWLSWLGRRRRACVLWNIIRYSSSMPKTSYRHRLLSTV